MLFNESTKLDVLESMICKLVQETPPDIIEAVHELTIRIENDHPLAYQKRKTDREKDLKIVSWANHLHKIGIIASHIMPLYEHTNIYHKENTPYTINELVTVYRGLQNQDQLDQDSMRSKEISERLKKEKDCICVEGWVLTRKIDKDYKFSKNNIIKVAIPCTKCYLGECKKKGIEKPAEHKVPKSENSNNQKENKYKKYNNNGNGSSYSKYQNDEYAN